MATNPSDELNAAATHDIANALVTVLGWARLAREGSVSAEEAMKAIEAAAATAHRTALDALGDPSEQGPTELGPLARDLVRLLSPQALERGVRLQVEAPHATWVDCPRTDALRMAWNLVLNAIQVLPAGGTVTLRVEPDGFVVSDDGPGMDRTTQRRVLDGGHSERPEGRGIGLMSVRQLVQAHGGTLSLESSPGRGARFRVELPLGVRDDASEVHSRPVVTTHEISRVLVVDDDDGVRELLSTTLRLRGLEVHAARTAGEVDALDQRFDVALVDLTLGEVSGLDVVGSVRARGLARLVVAMSGLPQLPEVDANRAPDHWLRKPFDATQLFDVLGLELDPPEPTVEAGSRV
ncbi:MAG: hybrid sensor histidine kinase/response regulator [Sandaracinus sp.]|nr:hybrid sensor histidine kinase/response regulator [Sandaracinus sp.]MCB9636116.1 hybrid sensor histidine kinase/response regulator [Sandaracinus sp.]